MQNYPYVHIYIVCIPMLKLGLGVEKKISFEKVELKIGVENYMLARLHNAIINI